MKIPYNILIQIKMSVRPYFKGFTLIFFFYNCRKQDYNRSDVDVKRNLNRFVSCGKHKKSLHIGNPMQRLASMSEFMIQRRFALIREFDS